MNEHIRIKPRPTTRAAEGLERWQWTVADLDRMIEAGILGEDDKIELIGGEFVPMPAQGTWHDDVRLPLTKWLQRRLSEVINASPEPGWRPTDSDYFEPDLLLHPAKFKGTTVPAPDVLLLIEIADASLSYDLKVKALKYAALGVREYWVIEAETLTTYVHREPGPKGYAGVRKHGPKKKLTPALIPGISLSMADVMQPSPG